jgi:hypothetical protein
MCQLTQRISGLGPLVQASVCVTEARAEALLRAGRPVPNPIPVVVALIDTGSDSVALDSLHAEKLSLPFHSIGIMHTVDRVKYPDVNSLFRAI